jgi:DNA-3-methyladenine glycosylase
VGVDANSIESGPGVTGAADGLPWYREPASAGGFPSRLFEGPAELVAPRLLGTRLRSTVGGVSTEGVIVEVEAYLGPHDPASHAAERIGRTARNEAMFGPPGTAYVYVIYGVHACVNVVTGKEGYPSAVLVRALEPLRGQDTMAERRGRPHDLTSGPGRLCVALGISRALNGHDLSHPPLELLPGWSLPEARVRVSPRIGISRAREWPLRFFVAGSHVVSRRMS